MRFLTKPWDSWRSHEIPDEAMDSWRSKLDSWQNREIPWRRSRIAYKVMTFPEEAASLSEEAWKKFLKSLKIHTRNYTEPYKVAEWTASLKYIYYILKHEYWVTWQLSSSTPPPPPTNTFASQKNLWAGWRGWGGEWTWRCGGEEGCCRLHICIHNRNSNKIYHIVVLQTNV